MNRNLQFVLLLFAALTLVPGLAHVFQMPQKMGLGPDSYRIAQVVYRGWALFGFFLVLAALFSFLYWFRLRRTPSGQPSTPFGIAFICYFFSLIIFFLFTYPVNRATANWTNLPDNWSQLRSQWEYSHAVAAALEVFAFILLAWNITRRLR